MPLRNRGLSILKNSLLSLTALGSFAVHAGTERMNIEAKMARKKITLELVFEKKQGESSELFTFNKFRVEFEGQSYPVISTHSGGSHSWCEVLGFAHLNFSAVGASAFEFDNEELGLVYRRETKDFLLTKFSRNTDNVVDVIQCTQNSDLAY